MKNKYKLLTILTAFVTAFSFLAATAPTSVNATPEDAAGGGV